MQASWLCAVALVLAGALPRRPPGRRLGADGRAALRAGAVARVRRGGAGDRAVGRPAGGERRRRRRDRHRASCSTRGGTSSPAATCSTTGRRPLGGEREPIAVVLIDGRKLAAELVGLDAESDVAVVRMFEPPHDLSAARFGDSDERSGRGVGAGRRQPARPRPDHHRRDHQQPAAGRERAAALAAPLPADRRQRQPRRLGRAPGRSRRGGGRADDGDQRRPGRQLRLRRPDQPRPRVAEALIKDGHALPSVHRRRAARPAGSRHRRAAQSRDDPRARRAGQPGLAERPAARAGLRPGTSSPRSTTSEIPTPADLVALIARAGGRGAGRHRVRSRRGQSHRSSRIADLPVADGWPAAAAGGPPTDQPSVGERSARSRGGSR